MILKMKNCLKVSLNLYSKSIWQKAKTSLFWRESPHDGFILMVRHKLGPTRTTIHHYRTQGEPAPHDGDAAATTRRRRFRNNTVIFRLSNEWRSLKKERKKEKGTTEKRLSKRLGKFVKILEIRAINTEIKHSVDKNKTEERHLKGLFEDITH